MSGSGISWAICKSAPRSRQITTPVPHHSVFYRPDALPVAQPTVSKHWRNKTMTFNRYINLPLVTSKGWSHVDYHTKPSMPDCKTWDPQQDRNCDGLTTSLQMSANLVSLSWNQRAKLEFWRSTFQTFISQKLHSRFCCNLHSSRQMNSNWRGG